MSWLKHMLLGEIGQSQDIIEAKRTVALHRKIQQQQTQHAIGRDIELARVKKRTEQLHLALTSLTRYLMAEGIVSEQKLAQFLNDVDLEDGVADGKLAFENESTKPDLNFD